MVISNDDMAVWERAVRSAAEDRVRRRRARAALRRDHATRRANGLIERQAARGARLPSTSGGRASGPEPPAERPPG
jgi:hypothetical protein